MNLPQIDVSTLPDLAAMTGMFGSVAHKAAMAAGDSTVVVMTSFTTAGSAKLRPGAEGLSIIQPSAAYARGVAALAGSLTAHMLPTPARLRSRRARNGTRSSLATVRPG